MKSALGIPPERFIKAEKLYARALRVYPALRCFDPVTLEAFRFKRNQIMHYGFRHRA
jgi:glutathionyl-hydroquinone reductase